MFSKNIPISDITASHFTTRPVYYSFFIGW